jgi:hypothetical protein
MKKLNNTVSILLQSAVSTYGTYDPDESFHSIEERLTIEQAMFSRAFMAWVYKEKLSFGSGNIKDVYIKFTKSKDYLSIEKEFNDDIQSISDNVEVKITDFTPRN